MPRKPRDPNRVAFSTDVTPVGKMFLNYLADHEDRYFHEIIDDMIAAYAEKKGYDLEPIKASINAGLVKLEPKRGGPRKGVDRISIPWV